MTSVLVLGHWLQVMVFLPYNPCFTPFAAVLTTRQTDTRPMLYVFCYGGSLHDYAAGETVVTGNHAAAIKARSTAIFN